MLEDLVKVHNLLIGIKVAGNDVFSMAESLRILRRLIEKETGKGAAEND